MFRRGRDRGQSLVEFSLVLIPFLLILMGIIDLGRGIYTYNGVAQAARELARVTSVHTCDTTRPSAPSGRRPRRPTSGAPRTRWCRPRRRHRDLRLHLDHRRDAVRAWIASRARS